MILHLKDKLILLGEELCGKRVPRCDKGQFFTPERQAAPLWKRKHIPLPDELHIAGDACIRRELRKGIKVVGHGAEKLLLPCGEVLLNRQIPVPAAKHRQGRHKHGYRSVAARITAPVIDCGKNNLLFQRVRRQKIAESCRSKHIFCCLMLLAECLQFSAGKIQCKGLIPAGKPAPLQVPLRQRCGIRITKLL